MSDVKTTRILDALRTILRKNPGVKAKFLIEKLRGRTGLSRSTLFEYFESFELRGQIYREKGRYWLKAPTEPGQQQPPEALNIIEKTWIAYAKTQIPWYRGGRAARSFAEEYERASRKGRLDLLRKKSKE